MQDHDCADQDAVEIGDDNVLRLLSCSICYNRSELNIKVCLWIQEQTYVIITVIAFLKMFN